MSRKKQNEQNLNLNLKITIATIVLIVWIIIGAILLSQCESQTNDTTSNQHPNTLTEETEKLLNPYKSTQSGVVANKDSKTVAYFNSHFANDYYHVIEMTSNMTDGSYTYQTITRAYTTDGYLYEKSTDTLYSEQEYGNTVIQFATPTNSYIVYPDMKTYFMSEGSTAGYTNTINFPGEQFKTGTITINGLDFYYEEIPQTTGVSTKYCFDSEDNLRYRISASNQGIVTERYIEYSTEVDMSIFEIPEDYVLQQ